MFRKKSLVALGLFLVLLILLAGCGGGQQPPAGDQGEKEEAKVETIFVNIATGGTAGTYYPLGGAMAEIFNKNIDGVNASAQSTGASVANVNLIKEDQVQIALIQNDIAYYAATGTEMFEGSQYSDLCGLASLYPETIQIITLASKGIDSVADLKGKKVAVGAAGSGTEANARQIMEAAGITYKDITVQYLSFGEAASNLKDGNIDAAFITAGFPTAAVQDVAASRDIKLVSLDSELIAKLINAYPFYTETPIPAGVYPKQDEEIQAVSVMAMLASSASLDKDLVYKMVQSIYTNLDRLEVAHAVGKQIKQDNATAGMSIDLHPGAQQFFEGK